MEQPDPKDVVSIPREEFEIIHAALKMVVTGEDYDESESVRLERRAWEIVSAAAQSG